MVLGTGNQEAFGGMPVAGLDIPVMTSEDGITGTSGEVKNLKCCIIRSREELCIAGTPCQVSHSIVMCIINCFDIVKVGSPVLDISLLTAGDEPVVTM
jgi:hypothetical protein